MARLNGASLFTGVSSGINNTYSVLANTFKDGVTLANLNSTKASTALTSNSLGTSFKSYLTSNFSQLDKDGDGVISAKELQNFTNSISTTGMTKEQLCTLGTSTGMSSSLINTVTQYFDEIDTNKDGQMDKILREGSASEPTFSTDVPTPKKSKMKGAKNPYGN